MCGIFGLAIAPGEPLSARAFERAIRRLFTLSEPRGREASGLLVAFEGRVDVIKRPLTPSRFLGSHDFRAFIDERVTRIERQARGGLPGALVALGHCRLVTHGAEVRQENNQPVHVGQTIGVHNGIVVNDEQLSSRREARLARLDSAALFERLDDAATRSGSLAVATREVFAAIEGTASIACLRDSSRLLLATNNGSLYCAHSPAQRRLVFTSERHSLSQYLADAPLAVDGAPRPISADRGLLLDLTRWELEHLDLAEGDLTEPLEVELGAGRAPEIVVHAPDARRAELRRCVRCILPETYPFIEFSAEGLCNYCRDHRPPELAGREALEAELAKHRRDDGRPDVIVAFSGGRDSSYGLHLLKRELGMNPVAYSYDWGMVTDVARRNQARVCGALGVEHILRAADIRRKRRYLRANILAWLERPHLGMVPLFMAGDKFFYQVGRELRRELQIPLVVFCAGNPLERTDFKGGFAGIRESMHGQRLFAFSVRNKLEIAAFYGWQYLRNPAYLNASFFESVRSYFETFIARDDFLYLYHYLPWDEETIDRTLIEGYGWETAQHTDNTWRIGDGYTTFINHIYYTVAGFSEFDVFRSQQIRAGLLTRERALALAERDNQADLGVLADFAGQIGLNLEDVLIRIDSIPRRY